MFRHLVLIISLALCTLSLPSSSVSAQTQSDWYMAGANPQRTSWVNEEIRGGLSVEWYRSLEAYIPYKVQPIAVNGKIYISTAKGLYAINATSGNLDFIYPTDLPLGHSPTVLSVNGLMTVYVGGYDKRIHAINANTGQPLPGYLPHIAGAGFETNPLVINNTIYAGNRDGKFYALNALTGAKIWEFPTNGPILFSAAYKDNVLYFASMDNHAYAINATTGQQVWKQGPFNGQGFHSFWPVVYTEKTTGRDYVSFGGSENYRQHEKSLGHEEWYYFFPHCTDNDPNTPCPVGELIGPSGTATSSDNYWLPGTNLIDTNRIREYHALHPFRRTLFILDAANGQEYRFDSNNDGVYEYAPMTWSGVTHGGNRYPAAVNAIDGIYYENTQYVSMNTYIPRGDPVGWKFGTQQISRIGGSHAIDEPMAVAFGGRVMYWALCCDREAGAIDVTIPFGQSGRSWTYVSYNFLSQAPDYRSMYNDGSTNYTDPDGWQVYSGKNQSKNGIYSNHGTVQSPPIPYQGRVYMLKGNAILAWKATSSSPNQLPFINSTSTTPSVDPTTTTQLRQKLETEIQKMLTSGHLRPGYHAGGFLDQYGVRRPLLRGLGEIFDYFSNPSDTVVTLLNALPHVSATMQSQIRTYLQTHYGPGRTYDITRISHIGWGSGAAREVYSIPPDVWSVFGTSNGAPLSPSTTPSCSGCGYWTSFPPYNFYAAWKYAQEFGGAATLFNAMSSKLEAPVDDTTLLTHPNILNHYIAGYYGYLELQKLAGLTESPSVRSTYTRILNLRTQNFSKENPWWPNFEYRRAMNISRNFISLTPELADHLHQYIRPAVEAAINEYTYIAPYWFVSKFDASYGEGTLQPLYDYSAIFQAKAKILKEPQQSLIKYIDVPAFETGDLFYIQNLVTTLEAPSDPNYTPAPSPTPINYSLDADTDIDILDIVILISRFTQNLVGDFNQNGRIDIFDFNLLLRQF